jgi:hypothetical protein
MASTCQFFLLLCMSGSSVVIVTGYELDGPGIESRWGEIFRDCPGRPWDPPSLLYNYYRVFPGGRKRAGRDAEPSPLLVPRSYNRVEVQLYPRAFVACKKSETYHCYVCSLCFVYCLCVNVYCIAVLCVLFVCKYVLYCCIMCTVCV